MSHFDINHKIDCFVSLIYFFIKEIVMGGHKGSKNVNRKFLVHMILMICYTLRSGNYISDEKQCSIYCFQKIG